MANQSMLRDTLRQSLHDVLNEVALDDAINLATPSVGTIGKPVGLLSPFGMASGAAAFRRGSSMQALGLLSQSSRNFPLSSASVRPSATLGMSSSELLLAAATSERRYLEEKRMALQLDRAHASIRQKAFENAVMNRRQSSSLLGLFNLRHAGMTGSPQSVPAMVSVPKDVSSKSQEPAKDTLQEIGTTLRVKTSPYIDVADAADPDPTDSRVKKTRGGVTEPFPEKLHRLLKEIEDDGNGDVISFYSHGRAIGIHKPDKFVNEIMPKYFKQSRLSSFQRQLNLYGFKRITAGRDAGGYYHELFLKGRPNMCLHMRRVGLPKGEDRRKMRMKNVQVDIDFYSMKPISTTTP